MGTGEVFLCSKCTKVFPTLSRYNQHLKTHSKPFQCKICGKAFALRSDVARHVNARHRVGQIRYPCSIGGCQFTTKRKDSLGQHIQNVHGKQTKKLLYQARGIRSRRQDSLQGEQPDITLSEAVPSVASQADNISLMLQAASAGNAKLLELLLCSGMQLAAQGDDGSTALHCAARAGHASLVDRLLLLGAPVDIQNLKGRTPLHEAILGQDLETFLSLLRRSERVHNTESSVNTTDTRHPAPLPEHPAKDYINTGQTPALHLATIVGHSVIVDTLLLLPGIDVNKRCAAGYAPLQYAARLGHSEIARRLLSHMDIEVDIRKGNGPGTSLWLAARYGHETVVENLLAVEALTLSVSDRFSLLAIEAALRGGHTNIAQRLIMNDKVQGTLSQRGMYNRTSRIVISAVGKGCKSLVEILLSLPGVSVNVGGVNVEDFQVQGWPFSAYITPLMCAVHYGNIEMVEILLRIQDIKVNATGICGETVLHIAASRGHIGALKLLVAREDLDPNIRAACNYPRRTPLLVAVAAGHLEAVKLLLEHKDIDINMRMDNKSALDFARENNRPDIAALLLSHGAIDDSSHKPSRPSITLDGILNPRADDIADIELYSPVHSDSYLAEPCGQGADTTDPYMGAPSWDEDIDLDDPFDITEFLKH